jgi:hypothetical protein
MSWSQYKTPILDLILKQNSSFHTKIQLLSRATLDMLTSTTHLYQHHHQINQSIMSIITPHLYTSNKLYYTNIPPHLSHTPTKENHSSLPLLSPTQPYDAKPIISPIWTPPITTPKKVSNPHSNDCLRTDNSKTQKLDQNHQIKLTFWSPPIHQITANKQTPLTYSNPLITRVNHQSRIRKQPKRGVS